MGAAVLLVAGLAWMMLETATATEWSCAKPAEIEHGYVEHLIKYHCNPHYQLRGSGNGTYKCDTKWVSPEGVAEVPVCEPVCGRPKNPPQQMQRIIGGLLARKGSFPWQGRLVTRHNLTVGATLISDQWLLTTGRNVYLNHSEGTSPEELAATLRLFLGGRGQLAAAIERVVLHPGYPHDVDLALLKLKEKVPLGEEVMPVCLPQKDYAQPGRVGYVSGWGRGASFAFADMLRYVQLPVAEDERCRQYYGARNGSVWVQPLLSNHTFCVGMSELREDTCYGDAGGAFVVQDPDDGAWYAAGILSYDKTCAAAKFGVYVSVPRVLAWLTATMAAG
ncbi:haptoglobin-like isoform X2 [Colius striatus]|uniref:haptoglobin-like isoform X2 n=1 Tax=Colius striatus TaxID=57412 RepID=UPI002B1D367D|nr:haptoglobin-like isoform X2 [Colius striatus]